MNPSKKIVVEACVASLEAAQLAQQAGVDRIELNQALELDGLTPSAGLVRRIVDQLDIPVIAMVRPKSGDFLYAPDQWETLVADARWLLEQGIAGIAFGALTANNEIDQERCQEMREIVANGELVFHKAFDEVTDPASSLQKLIDSGMDRVMTSGLAPTAMDGAAVIGGLIQQAANRIEVLPAGRIGSGNARQLVDLTDCQQIHGSFTNFESGDYCGEIESVIGSLSGDQNGS